MIYLLPFIIALAITPVIRKFALGKGLTDKADGDSLKIHKQPVALLGGLVIWLIVIAVLLVYGLRLTVYSKKIVWGMIAGGSLIFGVGLWDDVKGVRPIVRLLVQVLAGVVVLWAGIRVNFMPILWVAIPLTLFYIAGAINAFNVTDGMDGLCWFFLSWIKTGEYASCRFIGNFIYEPFGFSTL